MDPNDGQQGVKDNGSPLKQKGQAEKQKKKKRKKTSLTLGIGKEKKSKHEPNFNVNGQLAGPSLVLTSTDVGKICHTHVPINCKTRSRVRKQAQGRRAKSIYNHRIGRKGYSGLEEEIQQERTESIARHILWKKGRQDKSGSYGNEEVKEKAKKIDKVATDIENGTSTVEGSNDVLTQALGTEECQGHVQGGGALVTPTQHFHKPYSKCFSCESALAQISDLKKYVMTLATIFAQHGLEVPPIFPSNSLTESYGSNSAKCSAVHLETHKDDFGNQHDIGAQKEPDRSSSNPMDKDDFNDQHDIGAQKEPVCSSLNPMDKRRMEKYKGNDVWPSDDMVKPNARPCQLANPIIERVVARGYMYEFGDTNIIHGIAQCERNVRVSVHDLINDEYGDEPLPVSNANADNLCEAVGGFVSWPRQLVILKDHVVLKGTLAQLEYGDLKRLIFDFTLLVDKATREDPKAAILVAVDENAFQNNDYYSKPVKEIPLLKDELLHLINFEEIGCSLMRLYMCVLFKRAKELQVDSSIKFAEPTGTSGNLGMCNSEILYYNMDAVNNLRDCIFLYPYNIGYHWVLAVIDPKKRYMWHFDPLANSIDMKLLETLKFAFKSLDYSFKFKSTKKSPTFETAKCPRQIGTVECGYYVLRYMKDIIESHETHPASLFHNLEPYKTKMIDEVRADLIIYIRDNM